MIEFYRVNAAQEARALHDVSMTLHQHSFNVITMLDTATLEIMQAVLTGKLLPRSGNITLDGGAYSCPAKLFCITPAQNSLIETFSVAQNVYGMLGGVLFNHQEAIRKCRALIDRFGFDLRADMQVSRLNTEKQKLVELLRVFVRAPRILILTEVFDALSFENILLAKKLLAELREQGAYVILLTRKYEDIFKFGDAIFAFRNGHLIQSFTDEQVFEKPQRLYEALLGGSTIFDEKQFAMPGRDFDILDIIKIGTQYMLSQENVNGAFQKYAALTEQYFPGARCTIYVRSLSAGSTLSVCSSGKYPREQTPITEDALLQKLLAAQKELTVMRFDQNVHTNVPYFSYPSILYRAIRKGGECGGILQVSFPKPYAPQKQDLDYVEAICDEIFLILDNSRLMGNSSYLQEAHHRIKNNLQLVTSLLMLQKNYYLSREDEQFSGKDVEALIDSVMARIQSIAAIHDLLSRGKVVGEMMTLNAIFGEFRRLYAGAIELHIRNDITIPISQSRASSLALIVNELIHNSVKHNPQSAALSCWIDVVKKEETLELTYRDNGRGYPEKLDSHAGMAILQTLVNAEFWGDIRFYNDGGACAVLTIQAKTLG